MIYPHSTPSALSDLNHPRRAPDAAARWRAADREHTDEVLALLGAERERAIGGAWGEALTAAMDLLREQRSPAGLRSKSPKAGT